MPRFILTAFGPDNYGIVARVTSALSELNCNLADTSMSNLSGHFAMMLVIDADGSVDERAIFNSVQKKCAELNLVVDVKQVEETGNDALDGERYAVSVYGTDRPGIVSGICEVLALQGANIFDLTTRVIETEASLVYTMILEIALSNPSKLGVLEESLAKVAENLGVSCSIRSADSDEL